MRCRSLPAILIVGVTLAAGCSTNETTRSAATTTSRSRATTSSASTTSIAAATTSTPGTPDCTLDDLTVTTSDAGGAAGHLGLSVVLTDTGTRTCRVVGYPGVDGVTASNQRSSAVRVGADGGEVPRPLPVVVLSKGESAASLVLGSDVPTGTATSCVEFSSFVVTPPNETRSTTVSASLPGCGDLEIRPLAKS